MRKTVTFILGVSVVLGAVSLGAVRFLGATSANAFAPTYQRMNTTPPAGEHRRTHAQQAVDGQPWSIMSFTNEDGQICAGETVPDNGGDGGQGLTCRDKATLFSNGPLVYFAGARQLPTDPTRWANIWVWGWAAPQIGRIELQLTNCATVPVSIDSDRIFLRVFGAGMIHSGIAPQQLIAYDQTGVVLESKPVPVEAPSSPRAKAANVTAPKRADC